MGLTRWFFYGTSLPGDKDAKRNIDYGEPRGIVQKGVAKAEESTSKRKAKAAARKGR
jgi:hypothetical protein